MSIKVKKVTLNILLIYYIATIAIATVVVINAVVMPVCLRELS